MWGRGVSRAVCPVCRAAVLTRGRQPRRVFAKFVQSLPGTGPGFWQNVREFEQFLNLRLLKC